MRLIMVSLKYTDFMNLLFLYRSGLKHLDIQIHKALICNHMTFVYTISSTLGINRMRRNTKKTALVRGKVVPLNCYHGNGNRMAGYVVPNIMLQYYAYYDNRLYLLINYNINTQF